MTVVNMHEAKTNLSQLVRRAAAGEEIILAKAGEPVAKIVAYAPAKEPRKPGALKGQIKILPGFDEIPEEFEEYLP
jgi:prevent-host-death family protein